MAEGSRKMKINKENSNILMWNKGERERLKGRRKSIKDFLSIR